MVDFSDAIKEHINGLSPDELAATEARRLVREAEHRQLMILDALFEPAAGGTDAPVTKELTVQIDVPAAQGGDHILRFSQGSSYQETHFLTPAIYRLIAGGTDDPAVTRPVIPERFTVCPSTNEQGGVTVDRAALMATMETARPVESRRAKRLIGLEMRGMKTSTQTPDQRLARFTEGWNADILRATIDTALEGVPARTMAMIVGRDLVSLSVRKEGMIVGPEGLLKSPMAEAIVKPTPRPMRPTVLISGNLEIFRDQDAPYVKSTFGSGATRRLVIDVGKLNQILSPLASEQTETALALVRSLIARSTEIETEQQTAKALAAAEADRPVPARPAMFAAKHAPTPPKPAIELEAETNAPDVETTAVDVEQVIADADVPDLEVESAQPDVVVADTAAAEGEPEVVTNGAEPEPVIEPEPGAPEAEMTAVGLEPVIEDAAVPDLEAESAEAEPVVTEIAGKDGAPEVVTDEAEPEPADAELEAA